MVPAALLSPTALATDRGAVVLTPAGVLELRQLARRAWAWRGEDGRWLVVGAGQA